jgi:hypothetical protein
MTTSERDELTRLVREISEQFPTTSLASLVLDFCHWTGGTAYKSFWDIPNAELLATIRDLAESLKMKLELVADGDAERA